jgi:hypothetical protein
VESKFYKYPSTPHLAILPGVSVRNDKVLSAEEREFFLSHELIVEEKVDGANLGIFFDKNGNIQLKNRGEYIKEPFSAQWKKLGTWLRGKIDNLFELLEGERVLFGEWCYAKHSIFYDSLPDWFLAFDIFDKSNQRFWSVSRRNALLQQTSIYCVPELRRGIFTLFELEKLFAKSCFSEQLAEGLYLRHDEINWSVDRAKLVRPVFLQSIEEHWSRSRIQPNQLSRDWQG